MISFSSDEEGRFSPLSVNVNLIGPRYNPEGSSQLLAKAPKGMNSPFKNEDGFILW